MTAAADRLRQLLDAASPPPWRVDIEGGDEWYFGRGNQAVIRHRAEVWDSIMVGPGDAETHLANARLIALAPELANLCADMADWIGSPDLNGCYAGCEYVHGFLDEHEPRCQQAHALLARLDKLTAAARPV